MSTCQNLIVPVQDRWNLTIDLYRHCTGQVNSHNWPLPALYRTGELSQLTKYQLTSTAWHPYRTGELSQLTKYQLTSTGTRTRQVNSHNWPSINWPPLAPVQDRWNLTIDLYWHRTGLVNFHNSPPLAPVQDRWTLTIDLHWHQYTGQVNSHNWPPLAPYRTGELSQLTSTGTRTGQVNSLLVQLVALIKYHEGYCGCHNLIVPVQNRSALTVQLVAPIKYNGGFKKRIFIVCTHRMAVVLAATLE